MATRFITIDDDTPMLLPADLRAWMPENHVVHFVMEAVGMLDLSSKPDGLLVTGKENPGSFRSRGS